MITICIDSGHSLHINKKCDKRFDKNKTKEFILNDRIADMVQTQLEQYDCNVIRLDDTTGKNHIKLNDRIKKANSINPDIIISIHHNAGVRGGTGGGTSVYYGSNTTERKRQATDLYKAIINETKLIGNRSSPVVKTTKLAIVCKTKSPCLLIENGFMDSKTDVPIILSENHALKTSIGITNFLINELKLQPKKNTYYTVEVNFSTMTEALKCVEYLKEKRYTSKISKKE